MNEQKKKTINYRRCFSTYNDILDSNFTLQNIVETALKKVSKPWKRSLGSSCMQLLTEYSKKQACLCGRLVYYENGKKIPLVDTDKEGDTFEEIVEPRDSNGQTRNLQEHELFFSMRENHVVILPSKGLSIKDFKDFMVWLIQTEANLKVDNVIELNNLPAKSAINKIKKASISSVNIGGNLFRKSSQQSKIKSVQKHLDVNNEVMGFLKTFLRNDPILNDLEKASDPGSVYVGLNISYRSRIDKDGQKLMHALANTVGTTDLDTKIRLKDKTTIKGDELTISDSIAILHNDGIVSKEDALTNLTNWLVQAISDGRVT